MYVIVSEFEDRMVLADNNVYLNKEKAQLECDNLNKLWNTHSYEVERLNVVD